MFWTSSGSEVLKVCVIGQNFACFCADMYLRLYHREEMLDELRVFSRSKIIGAECFGQYVSILSVSGRLKMFYINGEVIKCIFSEDDANQMCGRFISSFFLTFKPFSYSLEYYI